MLQQTSLVSTASTYISTLSFSTLSSGAQNNATATNTLANASTGAGMLDSARFSCALISRVALSPKELVYAYGHVTGMGWDSAMPGLPA